MNIKLSILIPSVPERLPYLTRLVDELSRQAAGKPVEFLVLMENKKRTIGSKRNALIEQARGQFITFVDDDDRLTGYYVDRLLQEIEAVPQSDCIVFDVAVHFNGRFYKLCKYGKEHAYGQDASYFYRKPNHLMCYARRIAERYKFLDINHGEDDEWGERVSQAIQIQTRIRQVLYHYDYVEKPDSWWELKD